MIFHLQVMRVKTAWDLSRTAPWMLRKKISIVIEKTARESAGTPYLGLD